MIFDFLWIYIWFFTTASRQAFNISWLVGGHPVLDPVGLESEANRTLDILLNLLRSANSLPGSLTITVVNWWAFTCQYSFWFLHFMWSYFLIISESFHFLSLVRSWHLKQVIMWMDFISMNEGHINCILYTILYFVKC